MNLIRVAATGITAVFTVDHGTKPEFMREVEAARAAGKLKIDYAGILLVAIAFEGNAQ